MANQFLFFKWLRKKQQWSIALSLKHERIFVTNNPATEKALLALTEVSGRNLMAQKIASKRAGRWLVFTKIIISLLVLAKISADEENRGRLAFLPCIFA